MKWSWLAFGAGWLSSDVVCAAIVGGILVLERWARHRRDRAEIDALVARRGGDDGAEVWRP